MGSGGRKYTSLRPCPIGCRSTGVFKAGKFEEEILLQFYPNEVYLYDINVKLFRIEKQKRATKKSGLGTVQRVRDGDVEDED